MAWDPEEYATSIRSWIHDYDELQEQVARATTAVRARRILDLGIGAGETARRVLRLHPESRLVGIDSSPEMLRGAASVLPEARVTLLHQDLGVRLPDQTFDLVVSALAIHHLEGDTKAQLFLDVARHVHRSGIFVLGDVVVPQDPADALIENEEGYDFPSTIGEQVTWLKEAGFDPQVLWVRGDLAVIKGTLSTAVKEDA